MKLMPRDYVILSQIGRFKCVLGRHIKELAGFGTIRACDRRIKILMDNKYIHREKVFYGFPYVYSLTHKGKMLLGLNKRKEKIRPEQMKHDGVVVDVVISLMKESNLKLEKIVSEKEMNMASGFTVRKHRPDFIINDKDGKIAVEVELSLKSLKRLQMITKDNFLTYKGQIWYIERKNAKLAHILSEQQKKYPSFLILYLENLRGLDIC